MSSSLKLTIVFERSRLPKCILFKWCGKYNKVQKHKCSETCARKRECIFAMSPETLVRRASLLSTSSSVWFFCGFLRSLYGFCKATRHRQYLTGPDVKAKPPDIPRSFRLKRQCFVQPSTPSYVQSSFRTEWSRVPPQCSCTGTAGLAISFTRTIGALLEEAFVKRLTDPVRESSYTSCGRAPIVSSNIRARNGWFTTPRRANRKGCIHRFVLQPCVTRGGAGYVPAAQQAAPSCSSSTPELPSPLQPQGCVGILWDRASSFLLLARLVSTVADLLRFRAEYYEVASAIGSRRYPQAQQQGFLDQGAESSEKWGEESPLAATKRGKRRGNYMKVPIWLAEGGIRQGKMGMTVVSP